MVVVTGGLWRSSGGSVRRESWVEKKMKKERRVKQLKGRDGD